MEGRKGPLLVLEYPGGKGGGMNTKRYIEQVLEGKVKDFYAEMKKTRGRIHFQQDNAPSHTGKTVKKWLADHEIPFLFHPPNSPDLSPIERVWHELKDIIRSLVPQPSNIEQLKAAVYDAWDSLDIQDIDKHILGMCDRVTAVRKANGGHTRY